MQASRLATREGTLVVTFVFTQGQSIVFAGDSITDAGRTLDIGKIGDRLLGEGYVRNTVGLIDARYPDNGLQVHNTGIGGITSVDLVELWDEQVLARRPDWVTVMIGINDCNLTIADHELAVPPEAYERNCRDILTRTKAADVRIVLLEPFYMWPEDEPGHLQQRTLDLLADYRTIIRDLVKEFRTLHVRTHEAFQEQLRFRPLDEIGIEPVHPTPSGHLVIAHALLDVIGW
ncbi:SGNH/GDSL hydrolase family protein [Actinopolymorpha sp. B9G3]|uniref:SGNH/GDSL hydrolase family protein n=1 Tax=Actinopolymorpha sp. B9G3 TaxID=3158970 RepID=UPI0032D9676F